MTRRTSTRRGHLGHLLPDRCLLLDRLGTGGQRRQRWGAGGGAPCVHDSQFAVGAARKLAHLLEGRAEAQSFQLYQLLLFRLDGAHGMARSPPAGPASAGKADQDGRWWVHSQTERARVRCCGVHEHAPEYESALPSACEAYVGFENRPEIRHALTGVSAALQQKRRRMGGEVVAESQHGDPNTHT